MRWLGDGWLVGWGYRTEQYLNQSECCDILTTESPGAARKNWATKPGILPLRGLRTPSGGGGGPPPGGGQKVPFSQYFPKNFPVINWHLNRGGWVSQSSPLLSWWSPSQIPKKAQKRLANALLALKMPYIKGASRLYDRSLALI